MQKYPERLVTQYLPKLLLTQFSQLIWNYNIHFLAQNTRTYLYFLLTQLSVLNQKTNYFTQGISNIKFSPWTPGIRNKYLRDFLQFFSVDVLCIIDNKKNT